MAPGTQRTSLPLCTMHHLAPYPPTILALMVGVRPDTVGWRNAEAVEEAVDLAVAAAAVEEVAAVVAVVGRAVVRVILSV